MHRTDSQKEQSRINGSKSTSLLNPNNRSQGAAVKSGLFSPLPCLPTLGEDPEERLHLLKDHLDQYPSDNLLQLEQVKTMYLCHIKRQRVNRFEAEIFEAQSRACLAAGKNTDLLGGMVFLSAENTFNKLSLMESRFTRQYNNAYKLWFQSRRERIQDSTFLAPTTEEIFADLMRQPPPIQNIQIQPEPQSTQTESTTSISENPVAFARDTLHIEPDANQSKALEVQDRNIILNCSRQWGKSTTAAIKAVHHALLKPESTILVASKTLRQSGELMLNAQRARRGVQC